MIEPVLTPFEYLPNRVTYYDCQSAITLRDYSRQMEDLERAFGAEAKDYLIYKLLLMAWARLIRSARQINVMWTDAASAPQTYTTDGKVYYRL